MVKYTIVTCISKPEVYGKCLLKSVYETKNQDLQVVPIINHNNLYSASIALNLGIKASKSEYVVLAHQDITLKPCWFSKLDEIVGSLPEDWAILGCAGIALEAQRKDIGMWGGTLGPQIAVGTVFDSEEASEPYWDGIKEPTKVHCIDECLFVLKKNTGLRFDTQYQGFHFYGVDMCLQARAAGYGVYCGDLPIIHYGKYSSSMLGNNDYWKYYNLLHYKWHQRFPELLGTHMHWAENEMTSYIPFTMQSDDLEIKIKAMGFKK